MLSLAEIIFLLASGGQAETEEEEEEEGRVRAQHRRWEGGGVPPPPLLTTLRRSCPEIGGQVSQFRLAAISGKAIAWLGGRQKKGGCAPRYKEATDVVS